MDADPPPRFRTVPRSRAFEQIVAQFRTLLASGRLRPGDRLPGERELATILAVGRSSLREALRSLEALGILEIRAGLGTFVRTTTLPLAEPPGRATAREVLEARLLVEPQIAALAADRATAEDLATLERIVAEQAGEVAAGRSGTQADLAFHQAIHDAARNAVLRRIVRELRATLRAQRNLARHFPGRWAASVTEHRAILTAIAARDGAVAADRMHAHIETMLQVVLAAQVWADGE